MKNSRVQCDLKSCSFCRLCLKEWLPAIQEARQTILLKKGKQFIVEGEAVSGVYFVYEGAVKVHKQWGEKEIIIRFAKKGDIVGHRGLGTELIYPISATALENSQICFIELEFFMQSLKVNHEFLLHLTLFMADELKLSERKMRNMAHMPVRGRVALALLDLQEKFGVTDKGYINLPLSRQDLASYTGATYETVFRVLNDLSENGLIELDGKNTLIRNRQKLQEISKKPD